MDKEHFKLIYWFAVGIVAYTAGLSVWIIHIDHTHIAMILTFWLSTGAAGSIGYLIGASVKAKGGDSTTLPGTTTANISAEITSQPKENGE